MFRTLSYFPFGMYIDALTGVVSGTPQQSGAFSQRIAVRDANHNEVTVTLPLEIAP